MIRTPSPKVHEAADDQRHDLRSTIARASRLAAQATLAAVALSVLPACSVSIKGWSTRLTRSGEPIPMVMGKVENGWAIEAGAQVAHHVPLLKPSNMEGGHDYEIALTGAALWTYGKGDGYVGPTLTMGGSETRAFVDGKSISEGAFLFAPGVSNLNHVRDRWALRETVSLPMVHSFPGVRADFGAGYVLSSNLCNLYLEAGISAAYRPTDLEINGEKVDTFGLGWYFKAVFDAASNYCTANSPCPNPYRR